MEQPPPLVPSARRTEVELKRVTRSRVDDVAQDDPRVPPRREVPDAVVAVDRLALASEDLLHLREVVERELHRQRLRPVEGRKGRIRAEPIADRLLCGEGTEDAAVCRPGRRMQLHLDGASRPLRVSVVKRKARPHSRCAFILVDLLVFVLLHCVFPSCLMLAVGQPRTPVARPSGSLARGDTDRRIKTAVRFFLLVVVDAPDEGQRRPLLQLVENICRPSGRFAKQNR